MWNPFKKKTPLPSVNDLKRVQEKEPIDFWSSRHRFAEEQYKVPDNDNWKGNKYAERLIKEWLEHGKIVLAVDFDDTIYGWGFKDFKSNVMFSKTIQIIKMAQKLGCYVSIWSACAPDRYDEIRNYAKFNQFVIDSINENPIPLPYGNNRKMYYNHLLDDRAGLEQALSVLEYCCYRVMSDRKVKTDNFEV
jgi:hypothetical protein